MQWRGRVSRLRHEAPWGGGGGGVVGLSATRRATRRSRPRAARVERGWNGVPTRPPFEPAFPTGRLVAVGKDTALADRNHRPCSSIVLARPPSPPPPPLFPLRWPAAALKAPPLLAGGGRPPPPSPAKRGHSPPSRMRPSLRRRQRRRRLSPPPRPLPPTVTTIAAAMRSRRPWRADCPSHLAAAATTLAAGVTKNTTMTTTAAGAPRATARCRPRIRHPSRPSVGGCQSRCPWRPRAWAMVARGWRWRRRR